MKDKIKVKMEENVLRNLPARRAAVASVCWFASRGAINQLRMDVEMAMLLWNEG